jgi:molecular chaperone DnaK (HSP70)
LEKFEKHEKHLKEKSKIRNDLESTLYRLKDSYEEPYILKFSKEEELENLKKVVSEKLEWLDENAWTAEKDEF